MPNVTIKPWLAIFSPSRTVFVKAFTSFIKWSDGTTSITGSSLLFSVIYFAARAIAGAVFFAVGSDKTTELLLIFDNWYFTLEKCLTPVILMILVSGIISSSLSKVA